LTLAGSEENLLKAQHPGTAEPFRIAPAKPVAYTSLVTFYDEREWRYVPFADQKIKGTGKIPSGVRTMLSQKEYETGDVLAKAIAFQKNNYTVTVGTPLTQDRPEHVTSSSRE
jgi:hypothetical protein